MSATATPHRADIRGLALDTVLAIAEGKRVPAAFVNVVAAMDRLDQGLGQLPFEVRGFVVHWPQAAVCTACPKRAFLPDGPAMRTHADLSGHQFRLEDRRPWNLPKE